MTYNVFSGTLNPTHFASSTTHMKCKEQKCNISDSANIQKKKKTCEKGGLSVLIVRGSNVVVI